MLAASKTPAIQLPQHILICYHIWHQQISESATHTQTCFVLQGKSCAQGPDLIVATRAAHLHVKGVAVAVAAGQLHLPDAAVAMVVNDCAGGVDISDVGWQRADNCLVGEVAGQVDLGGVKRQGHARVRGLHIEGG